MSKVSSVVFSRYLKLKGIVEFSDWEKLVDVNKIIFFDLKLSLKTRFSQGVRIIE